MLNSNEFANLERRLYAEGNPLADELVSTRDELLYLLKEAKKVMQKYASDLSTLSDDDDLDYFREWDEFGDALDNLSYELGTDSSIQYKLHEGV